MAKKMIEFPKYHTYMAIFTLGKRFEKGARLPNFSDGAERHPA